MDSFTIEKKVAGGEIGRLKDQRAVKESVRIERNIPKEEIGYLERFDRRFGPNNLAIVNRSGTFLMSKSFSKTCSRNLVVMVIFENLPLGRSGPYFRVL